jgi:hypothetical protein
MHDMLRQGVIRLSPSAFSASVTELLFKKGDDSGDSLSTTLH